MQDRKIQITILTGALLITGLFLIWPTGKQRATEGLKPSDFDFKVGNYPAKVKQTEIFNEKPKPVIKLDPQQTLSQEDQKKWQTFQEIIFSRNDNDPRIDGELKDLSTVMHENLHKAYEALPDEDRNSRGLIAFLIARDLKTAADAEFLKKIYEESPCLSFDNCSVAAPADPHFDGVNQTSLNYPQLAGLYQLEKKLQSNPDILRNPELRRKVTDLLREARQFPSDPIQQRAEAIRSQHGL